MSFKTFHQKETFGDMYESLYLDEADSIKIDGKSIKAGKVINSVSQGKIIGTVFGSKSDIKKDIKKYEGKGYSFIYFIDAGAHTVRVVDKGLNEAVYDAQGDIGKKRVTKPMSAKSDEDAIKQFKDFVKLTQKNGHLPKGELTNIKVKKA